MDSLLEIFLSEETAIEYLLDRGVYDCEKSAQYAEN